MEAKELQEIIKDSPSHQLCYQAGIKEVVEWVKYVGLKGSPFPDRLIIGGREWQAKLKEWGLE